MKTKLYIRTSLLLIGVLIFGLHSYAQQPASGEAKIEVTYLDHKTKTPEPNASLRFTDKATNKRYAIETDEEGKGTIIVPQGTALQIQANYLDKWYDYDPLEVPEAEGPVNMTYTLYKPMITYTKVYRLNVHFDTDKATIKENSYPSLNAFTDTLRKHPKMQVEIAGHTDNVGGTSYNRQLSQRRAEAVRDYFLKKGVDASRLRAKGYGEAEPIADNNTETGRQKNRRTEIRVVRE